MVAAEALHENAELRNMVSRDSKTIMNGDHQFKGVLDRYFFLLKVNERSLKIPEQKATVQLAAFGLFQYADWSWKRSRAARVTRNS